MASREAPQTAIVESGVLKRDPEAQESVWLPEKIRGILMNADFGSHLRGLQDSHRLNHEGVFNPESSADLVGLVRVGDVLKYLIFLVEGMAYLIDGLSFGDDEFPVKPGVAFVKEADLISRVQEILDSFGIFCSLFAKNGHLFWSGIE